ncbi:type II secretion system GspH family protein [Acidobacteria bacterium AH-259-D05]|nr:type II secretion system GspH family protein [Acidobacteria bacterium AH-259-D05]
MPMHKVRGFTLLEIVVALAILGMGVGVVMQIFSGGLKNIHRIDLAHQAMNHAENVMNEILSDETIVGEVSLAGDLDEEFDYMAEVRHWEEPEDNLSIEVAEPAAYLLSVRVDVHFKNDPHGKLYRTECLKTVPNETGGPVRTSVDAIRQLFGARQ